MYMSDGIANRQMSKMNTNTGIIQTGNTIKHSTSTYRVIWQRVAVCFELHGSFSWMPKCIVTTVVSMILVMLGSTGIVIWQMHAVAFVSWTTVQCFDLYVSVLAMVCSPHIDRFNTHRRISWSRTEAWSLWVWVEWLVVVCESRVLWSCSSKLVVPEGSHTFFNALCT